MKKEIPVQKSTSLINPGCVVLASLKYKEKANIITLAWQTPLSIKPKLLGISVGFSRFSHDMIQNAGEFAINIPGKNLLEAVHGCGRISGKDTDKFQKFHLTEEPSANIPSPGVEDCLGIIECTLVDQFTTGDHTFFVGRVLGAKAEETAYDFDKFCWKTQPESELLYHLGGNHYLTGSSYLKI